jgi:hypothetical protein
VIELEHQVDDVAIAELVEVWLALGQHRRWRVRSAEHTYGEWDRLDDAQAFLRLLVTGNLELVELA